VRSIQLDIETLSVVTVFVAAAAAHATDVPLQPRAERGERRRWRRVPA